MKQRKAPAPGSQGNTNEYKNSSPVRSRAAAAAQERRDRYATQQQSYVCKNLGNGALLSVCKREGSAPAATTRLTITLSSPIHPRMVLSVRGCAPHPQGTCCRIGSRDNY